MDIDRLHRTLLHGGGRNCGKTYAQLVVAIQSLELSDGSSAIYAMHNYDDFRWLLRMVETICNELGYSLVVHKSAQQCVIDGKRLDFVSQYDLRQRTAGMRTTIDADHVVHEFGDSWAQWQYRNLPWGDSE